MDEGRKILSIRKRGGRASSLTRNEESEVLWSGDRLF